MSKMIVLRGLPGAGKTTFAKEYQKTHPETVRVNRDTLRDMMYDSQWTKEREKLVKETEEYIVQLALLEKRDVIVDDTNLDPDVFFKWQEVAKFHNENLVKGFIRSTDDLSVEFEVKDFDTSVEQCKINNAKRTGRWRVPDDVIDRFYDKYLKNEKK